MLRSQIYLIRSVLRTNVIFTLHTGHVCFRIVYPFSREGAPSGVVAVARAMEFGYSATAGEPLEKMDEVSVNITH
jgi:hypothetical protein